MPRKRSQSAGSSRSSDPDWTPTKEDGSISPSPKKIKLKSGPVAESTAKRRLAKNTNITRPSRSSDPDWTPTKDSSSSTTPSPKTSKEKSSPQSTTGKRQAKSTNNGSARLSDPDQTPKKESSSASPKTMKLRRSPVTESTTRKRRTSNNSLSPEIQIKTEESPGLSSRWLVCQYCKRKKFDRPTRLEQHQKRCQKQCVLFQEIVKQLQQKQLRIPARVCFTCQQAFINASHLRRHNRKVHGDIYFEESKRLESKLALKMTPNDRKPYPCRYCGKNCHRKDRIEAHERRCGNRAIKEKKVCTCSICTKTFTSLAHLKRHESSCHQEERPYLCQTCGKGFFDSAALKSHQARHSGVKPFACQFCEMKFYKSNDLKKHERKHTGDKPFKCELCPKQFARGDARNNHQKTHTGTKPYKCDKCEKSFSQQGYMKIHMRTHLDQPPFQCEHCEESFITKAKLKKHMAMHSLRQFKCKECEQSFMRQDRLDKHILKEHGDTSSSIDNGGKEREVKKEAVAKEVVAKEVAAKEVVAQEAVAEDEVAEEEVAEDEVAVEEVAEEEVAKEVTQVEEDVERTQVASTCSERVASTANFTPEKEEQGEESTTSDSESNSSSIAKLRQDGVSLECRTAEKPSIDRRRGARRMLERDVVNISNPSYDNFDVPTEVLIDYSEGDQDPSCAEDEGQCMACVDQDPSSAEDEGQCMACVNEMKPLVKSRVLQYIKSVAKELKGSIKNDLQLTDESSDESLKKEMVEADDDDEEEASNDNEEEADVQNEDEDEGECSDNGELEQTNEDFDETNEDFDETNEDLDETNEDFDETNEDLDETNGDFDETNEVFDETNEDFEEGNEGIDETNEDFYETNEDFDETYEDCDEMNGDCQDQNEDGDETNECDENDEDSDGDGNESTNGDCNDNDETNEECDENEDDCDENEDECNENDKDGDENDKDCDESNDGDCEETTEEWDEDGDDCDENDEDCIDTNDSCDDANGETNEKGCGEDDGESQGGSNQDGEVTNNNNTPQKANNLIENNKRTDRSKSVPTLGTVDRNGIPGGSFPNEYVPTNYLQQTYPEPSGENEVLRSLKVLCENFEELSSGDEEICSKSSIKSRDKIDELIQKETEFLEHFDNDSRVTNESTDSEVVIVKKSVRNYVRQDGSTNDTNGNIADLPNSAASPNSTQTKARKGRTRTDSVKSNTSDHLETREQDCSDKPVVAAKKRKPRKDKGKPKSEQSKTNLGEGESNAGQGEPSSGKEEGNCEKEKHILGKGKNGTSSFDKEKHDSLLVKSSSGKRKTSSGNVKTSVRQEQRSPEQGPSQEQYLSPGQATFQKSFRNGLICQYCHLRVQKKHRLKGHELKCLALKRKFEHLDKHPELVRKSFSDAKTYRCHFCIKDCKARQRFEQHWRLCQQRKRRIEQVKLGLTGPAEFKCNYCGREFLEKNAWAQHEKECLELEQRYQEIMQRPAVSAHNQCKHCHKIFDRIFMWERHEERCATKQQVPGKRTYRKRQQQQPSSSTTPSTSNQSAAVPTLDAPLLPTSPDSNQAPTRSLQRLSMDLEFKFTPLNLNSPRPSLRSSQPKHCDSESDTESEATPSPAKRTKNNKRVKHQRKTRPRKFKGSSDPKEASPTVTPRSSPSKKTTPPKKSSLQLKSLQLKKKSVQQQTTSMKRHSHRCRYCNEKWYNIEKLIMHERRCLFVKDYSELPSQLRDHFGFF